MDVKDIRDLILTVDKTGIQRVEIEIKDTKILISKEVPREVSSGQVDNRDNYIIRDEKASSQMEKRLDQEDQDLEEVEVEGEFFYVKSPIVGVYYGAASPDSQAFVKIGDKVEAGQTLCIVEAMKIMNEIECEVSGEIVELFVKDEDVIQYGQSLMKIRR